MTGARAAIQARPSLPARGPLDPDYAARSRMWTPHAEPSPMTSASPTSRASICRSPLRREGGGRPPRCWRCRWRRSGGPSTRGRPTRSPASRRHATSPTRRSRPRRPLAQAEVVVVHELHGREAVVQLDEVEVFGADAGLLVGLLGRLRVSVLTLGRIWHASCHGRSSARTPRSSRRAAAAQASVLSFESDTTTAAAAPSQLAEHIGRVFG